MKRLITPPEINPAQKNQSVQVSPPGPKSRELLARMKKVIGRSNYFGLYGITLVGGKGAYVIDIDGNVYLDCLAAASCNLLGYNYHQVADAYYQVALTLQNSCFPYSPNPQAVELAEHLIRITPGGSSKKVLLGLSGSDACDGAIQAMRKYTQKFALIKFKNDYHGSTGFSQAASGFRTLNVGIFPKSPNFITMNYPVTRQQRDRVLEKIERTLMKGRVGGVMAESIQGDAGIHVPYPGFFSRLRELLDRYNGLLIIDEVQSGMGRTGKWWAIEHEDVVPDLLVTAKGLSAGYAPISALVGREEVIDALAPAQHLFTYTGHPPSAAVASKVIQLIEENNLIANAAQVGARMLAGLKQVKDAFPQVVTEVRGRGLMIGVEINIFNNQWASKLFATRCVEKGVYLGYFGVNQEVLRIEPPLILSDEEAALVIKTIYEVAEEMSSNQIPQTTMDKVHQYAIGL
jgi:4-aminobutyrate aminotransferase-like enzyme